MDTSHGQDSFGRAIYVERINLVMDFIEAHIGDKLGLDELADVANFSRFHFHRVFAAMVGETPHVFVARRRVERAAALLCQRREQSITDIGLDCGFATPSAFARSFKAAYSMTPSEWRSGGRGQHGEPDGGAHRRLSGGSDVAVRRLYDPRRGIDGWALECDLRPATVSIETLPDVEVAYVRHTGSFQGSPEFFADLFGQLSIWAAKVSIPMAEIETFALYHDEPGLTDDMKLRVSACVQVPSSVLTSGFVGRTTIAGGEYAVARFELADSEYQAAWAALLGGWLPQSGYEPADRPFFFERFPPLECGGGRRIVDICVPVRPVRS